MPHYPDCICGKVSFPTEKAAEAFLESPKAAQYGVIRVYQCPYSAGYHTTKVEKYFDRKLTVLEKLELELRREMATMKEFIVDYMAKAYEERNVVEFETRGVTDAYIKKFPTGNRGSVSAAISQLKNANIIVDLKKPVPGGSYQSTFFTLAKILEKETNPVSKTTVPEQPKKKPDVTPAVVPNPFDKVNSTLGDILTKVNGLAQGYAELVEIERKRSNSDANSFGQVLEALHQISVNAPEPAQVEIDATVTTVIAEAVNLRLSDITKDDSFIYGVRNEVMTGYEHIVKQIKIPETVTNSDDYKAGLKEGVRLASEMGLMIRE